MKIAIPVENGRLHGHFGGCRQFAVVEVNPETRVILHSQSLPAPEHQPGLFPRWLREHGVQVVIADGIGRRALGLFAEHGISVRAGQPAATVEELVSAFLAGQLTGAPQGCAHQEHEEGHHHHHRPHPHAPAA
jgi:predicted Fe-Mo cluster-binding NifX family protein